MALQAEGRELWSTELHHFLDTKRDPQHTLGAFILTESADSNLAEILYDVPNVSINYCRVTLEFVAQERGILA